MASDPKRAWTLAVTATSSQTLSKWLLENFPDVFDEKLIIPNTKLPKGLKYKLKTAEGRAVYQRPYHTNNEEEHQALQLTLALLQKDGLLQPARPGVWTSPARVVPKKDGSWRLACNYIQLNNITEPDKYPLPSLERIQAKVAGARVLVAMDFYKGFHNIPISADAAKKSAITTEHGTFEWRAMPMGGCTGPAMSQRMNDTVFN